MVDLVAVMLLAPVFVAVVELQYLDLAQPRLPHDLSVYFHC